MIKIEDIRLAQSAFPDLFHAVLVGKDKPKQHQEFNKMAKEARDYGWNVDESQMPVEPDGWEPVLVGEGE